MSERTPSSLRESRAQPAGRQGLRARRQRLRRRIIISLLILLLVLGGLADYGLWQKPVRISRIGIVGADPALATLAQDALSGTYLGIIPRDSGFFIPSSAIRNGILAAHPEIAAVSVRHDGLAGIVIRADARVPIARWCGLGPTEGVDEYCYLVDANGFVFSVADASSTPLNPFKVYVPLIGGTSTEPLRATIAHADVLPSTFDFARQLSTLGSAVTSVIVNDDEVSDVLASGTRITYVLGAEQQAFAALVSSKGQFDLSDGSIDYVDLRFPGKVYLKKKDGDTVTE